MFSRRGTSLPPPSPTKVCFQKNAPICLLLFNILASYFARPQDVYDSDQYRSQNPLAMNNCSTNTETREAVVRTVAMSTSLHQVREESVDKDVERQGMWQAEQPDSLEQSVRREVRNVPVIG